MALKYAINSALSNITALPAGIPSGSLILLSTQTASSSASLEFSIDGTYDSYVFKFINIHPATGGNFEFNMSTDGGLNYNVTKTTTWFYATHNEADTATALAYSTGSDLAQSTAFQKISDGVGNDNDEGIQVSPTAISLKEFSGKTNEIQHNRFYQIVGSA